jgi:hypothetical protein
MTNRGMRRHVEITEGDRTVVAGDVTTNQEAGTVRVSVRAASGHIAPGSRAGLVDAVMDLPEVQQSKRLEAAVPLGDGESLDRFRERCTDVTTRAAGSSALLDANIPPASTPGSGQDPGGEPSAP